MTQDKAFKLFTKDLEPKTREKIGYYVEGGLGKEMPIAEKADVWRSEGKGNEKGHKS